jgi:sugar/nucleoside kinase (ribokinase family)
MDNLDILGVGNALVDETFYIKEDLVKKTNLNFNQFKQISYSEQQEIKLLMENQDPEIVCGGSTTNSLVAASNFGSKCGHICQLGRDSLGDLYEDNLKKNKIKVINSLSLVLMSPNSERTMGTYLGASENLQFSKDFLVALEKSQILFSEGYQFTSDQNYDVFLQLLKMANHEVDFALSLSDPNVVNIFKDRFLEVLKFKHAKYLFCNAQNFVVTDGANESLIYEDGKSSNIKAFKVNAIDSNGAGDIFAGGCLHAIVSGEDFHESCKFGNYASSQIVQEKSPRLSQKGYIKLKENYLEL